MKIYLDNAATTPVDPEVFKAMKPYFSEKFGNASEPHFWGQEARKAIDQAREKVAQTLGAKSKEIIFTSCATESINLAHKGLIENVKCQMSNVKYPHIITSSIEHKAVLETCKHLGKLGMAKVTYLPVDKYGMVRAEDVERAIKPETVLVSIMYVNNEVGTIQPIEEIGRLIKKINVSRLTSPPDSLRDSKRAGHVSPIYFHTDATQAIQCLDCNVDKLGIDLLSLTGHKIYAPKGIGALYIKKGTPIVRQQDGGGQEYQLRAGTENVPYIVGLGKAMELVQKNKAQTFVPSSGRGSAKRIEGLRNILIGGVLKIPGVELTGHPTKCASHIASFIVKGAEGEAMLLLLSDRGIAASSGSACTSGLLEPSHVLTAMGYKPQEAHGSLRFSLGKDNTKEDIDYVIKVLPEIIKRLRKMAPKLGASV